MSLQYLKYLPLFLSGNIQKMALVTNAVLRRNTSYYPAYLEKFEQRFASTVQRQYGLTFCNGTSAIEATMFALGIKPGDEVIVPSCTFHASIDPVINLGATPVFADVDPNNLSLCPVDLRKKITSKTRAVVVTHLFGIPADMARVSEICREFDLELLEDASHAHGAIAAGRPCGSFGRVGAFSLQGNKAVAAGEGGIAVTDERDLYIRMSFFGHFSRHGDLFDEVGLGAFKDIGLGHKKRMAPLGAILADVDLAQLPSVNGIMNKTADMLDRHLLPIESINIPRVPENSARGGFFSGYPFSLKHPEKRERLVGELARIGVETRSYPFQFHHKMPVYDPQMRALALEGGRLQADESGFASLPVTESLPASLVLIRRKHLINLSEAKIIRIAKTIRDIAA